MPELNGIGFTYNFKGDKESEQFNGLAVTSKFLLKDTDFFSGDFTSVIVHFKQNLCLYPSGLV